MLIRTQVKVHMAVKYLKFRHRQTMFYIYVAISEMSTDSTQILERSVSTSKENVLFSDEFEITFEGTSLGLLLVGLYT